MSSIFGKVSSTISQVANGAKETADKVKEGVGSTSQDIKPLIEKAVAAISENSQKFATYYSESGLNEKLAKFGKKVGSTVVYPVILLYTAMKSPDVPVKHKLMITACLGYFILPVDFIADYIPGVGFADDIAALSACLAAVKNMLTPEVYAEASEQIRKLFGEVDAELMGKIVDTAVKSAKRK